jgi:hypothetical protein
MLHVSKKVDIGISRRSKRLIVMLAKQEREGEVTNGISSGSHRGSRVQTGQIREWILKLQISEHSAQKK